MEKRNNSNLQGLITKEKVLSWTCSECEQPFTEMDYKEKIERCDLARIIMNEKI